MGDGKAAIQSGLHDHGFRTLLPRAQIERTPHPLTSSNEFLLLFLVVVFLLLLLLLLLVLFLHHRPGFRGLAAAVAVAIHAFDAQRGPRSGASFLIPTSTAIDIL